jgi:hypothetical protein
MTTPEGHVAVWENPYLICDPGLRTALVSGTDVSSGGRGGHVEQLAQRLVAGGIGSHQMRLFCSTVQCCGLYYPPAGPEDPGLVEWESANQPSDWERVAAEARASAVRARILLAAVQSIEKSRVFNGQPPQPQQLLNRQDVDIEPSGSREIPSSTVAAATPDGFLDRTTGAACRRETSRSRDRSRSGQRTTMTRFENNAWDLPDCNLR